MKLLLLWLLAAHASAAARHTDRISGAKEFEALSAPAAGGARELMFVVDHRHGDRLSFIDSNKYAGHMAFLNDELLTAKEGTLFVRLAVDARERPFTVGWVTRRPGAGYGIEFWADDNFSPEHSESVQKLVSASFFARLAPPRARPADSYRVLNPGRAVGVLRVGSLAGRPADDAVLVVDDLDLEEVPIPAALLLRRATSPASHLAILSQSLGIPAAIVPGWDAAPWAGKRVAVEFGPKSLSIEPTEERAAKRPPSRLRLPGTLAPAPLRDLYELRGGDSVRYGAKAANLGETWNARIEGLAVPEGFAVPFHDYAAFLRENGLQELARRAATLEAADAALLGELRRRIEEGKLPAELEKRLREKLAERLKGRPVFVRSSTNAEDLPGFTGAGLHKTVPNVRSADEVLRALREVWASLWNERAFEARRRFGIDQRTAFAGALIQAAVDSDAAGVMLTADPERPEREDVVFIAAKRGLGIRVVGGFALPEQIVYDPKLDRAFMVSKSGEETELRLAAGGGVESVPTGKGEPVLEHAQIRELGRLASRVEEHFGGRPLEIDWAISKGKTWILQSRRIAARAGPKIR